MHIGNSIVKLQYHQAGGGDSSAHAETVRTGRRSDRGPFDGFQMVSRAGGFACLFCTDALHSNLMKLHVNVDHVATLRQARGTPYPDPEAAAILAERAGADGITVHLREDRRHIQDADLQALRKSVVGVLNLEMAATDEMVAIALAVRPDVVTLVPEKREERTTEGGLDLVGGWAQVAAAVARLSSGRIPVSLFIDPDEQSVRIAAALAAPRIELHTGDYCARSEALLPPPAAELQRLVSAARLGANLGLHVAAGHGLAVTNVGPVAAVPEIVELNIGHAIVARAVLVGMESAVAEMRNAIRESRAGSLP